MQTILLPLIGGALIGLSTTLMLAFLGRVTGVSGILGALFVKQESDQSWRWMFVGGLIFGGFIVKFIKPELFSYDFNLSTELIIVAGLIVGFGTRMGGGCTSGHGVCGLPRLSGRSLAATLTFMGFGVLTVAIKGSLL